jgi:hypothetical protein
MDVYDGQVDLDHQVHDYNPGIPDSGLFWVVRVTKDAVKFDERKRKASLHVTDLELGDFGNILHALRGDPSVPATVSFDIHWKDLIQPLQLRDEDNQFEGKFLQTHAFIEWSARQDGFEFLSDPLETSETVFAMFGSERNGVFFR